METKKILPRSQRLQFVKPNPQFNMHNDKDLTNFMIPYEKHIWNGIIAWTNVTSSRNPLSNMETLDIPIGNQIRPNTIQIWKTELGKNGYFIAINDKYLNISPIKPYDN